jgi:hypothetical protein
MPLISQNPAPARQRYKTSAAQGASPIFGSIYTFFPTCQIFFSKERRLCGNWTDEKSNAETENGSRKKENVRGET